MTCSSCNADTRQKSGELVGGQLAEQSLQTTACPTLQSVSHLAHAEQKQTKTADEREYVENIHRFFSFSFLLG